MAWQKNYTDQYNENYPSSYWRVVQCNIQKEEKTGQITLNGYSNQSASGKRIIGQKYYAITPERYDKFFLPSLIQPQGIDHIKQCYAFALDILDTPTGEQDEDGKDICASFFNGATDI